MSDANPEKPEHANAAALEIEMQHRLSTLNPQQIDLIDDSALHAGHAGAQNGGRHYRLRIVSTEFAGLSTLNRHRRIYVALGDLMHSKIHALSINALTPEEIDSRP
ncbi:BolA family protein [Propionivibrio limicola]|uniref:BolA family protein n=1 Tax=Propionivibrio limicola TaxID=167645 RepID=UPI001FEB057B|nr:BolA family protein [Propionivibrio limicola]